MRQLQNVQLAILRSKIDPDEEPMCVVYAAGLTEAEIKADLVDEFLEEEFDLQIVKQGLFGK